MARNVKISLVAPRQAVAGNPRDLKTMVDRMKSHLFANISRVLPDKPDIIILPEVCDGYADLNAEQKNEYYLYRGDLIRDFLAEVANDNNCYIAYSAIRNIPGDIQKPFRNSTQIIGRDGLVTGVYDKNHLTIQECDNEGIAYGTEANVIELDFGKVACAICFDLNFDNLFYRYKPQNPELIIFSSMYHGGLAQQRWAFDNRAFFAGAICGDQSRILNPFGETVATSTNYYSFVTTKVNLDHKLIHISYNDSKYYAAKRKYGDGLTIYDPGHVGAVSLTCERDDMTVMDIIKEFDMEIFDDYLNRSLEHRYKNI